MCLSLSSCWKPKSQEGNKSFVPELKKVVSVSGFPMYISHIRILVLSWIYYNISTHLGSSVSSTEKDIDTRLTKAWTAIDTATWMHYLDVNKTVGEKARRQLHKNAAGNTDHVLEATPHKASTILPRSSHHENYPS